MRITVAYLRHAHLQPGAQRGPLRTWPYPGLWVKCAAVASGQPLSGVPLLWLNSSFHLYPGSRNWVVVINSSFHIYPSSRNWVAFLVPCDQVPALYMLLPLDSYHHSLMNIS